MFHSACRCAAIAALAAAGSKRAAWITLKGQAV
jgi:hypothetical protein